ncbi:1-aminocyclopropane-1-carboxylate deaminase/D-cysteine desulfhydrase [Amphritea pacifica]|uniref:1-aminocyclopropane-1-carboxylate deaminase/D-cysteine desulfhydrase n=1 Tax=Amphritea pacifica TaxID=2811233 RepID=UPI00196521C8|nr:pyridoxal-phosphate dependent enzyme [Amphritea pacifica]MBN1006823.1 pyridoxal-phosphate dependent enzyme [Amphritea pacifica]
MKTLPVVLLQQPEIPVEKVLLPEFEQAGVQLDLLRLDLIHPLISGNKWFKLKYALEAVQASDCHRVLSFGGAWSNHLHALAYAGYELGIETIGVIRGERPAQLSATLMDAVGWGMTLEFVSRNQYRNKYDEQFNTALQQKYGDFHCLPEGGSGEWVVAGCREIISLFKATDYQLICCACGTGGTLAGLIAEKPEGVELLGVPVLKGAEFLYHDIRQMLARAEERDPGGWLLDLSSHEGGYARVSVELVDALRHFRECSGIELEPVYSGKAFLALQRKLARGELPPGSRVMLIHTGGMQGLRGMQDRLSKTLR